MSFRKMVNENLYGRKNASIRILLEKEEDEKPEDDSNDIFDMGSDEKEEEESNEEETSGENEEEGEKDTDSGNEDSRKELELQSIASLVDYLERASRERTPEFGSAMSAIVKENKKYFRNSISNFLIKEDSDSAEDVIDNFEKVLDKSDDIIDRAKKTKAKLSAGSVIDIDEEVSIAIDKLIHFKEKVDIIDLIEDLFCNKIRLTAEIDNIDEYIEDFKVKYAEAVHKNRAKIDLPGSKYYNDESVYLDKADNYNGAAGARSQG